MSEPVNRGHSMLRWRICCSIAGPCRHSAETMLSAEGFVGIDAILEEMINADEFAAHADRPGHWRGMDLEH